MKIRLCSGLIVLATTLIVVNAQCTLNDTDYLGCAQDVAKVQFHVIINALRSNFATLIMMNIISFCRLRSVLLQSI